MTFKLNSEATYPIFLDYLFWHFYVVQACWIHVRTRILLYWCGNHRLYIKMDVANLRSPIGLYCVSLNYYYIIISVSKWALTCLEPITTESALRDDLLWKDVIAWLKYCAFSSLSSQNSPLTINFIFSTHCWLVFVDIIFVLNRAMFKACMYFNFLIMLAVSTAIVQTKICQNPCLVDQNKHPLDTVVKAIVLC